MVRRVHRFLTFCDFRFLTVALYFVWSKKIISQMLLFWPKRHEVYPFFASIFRKSQKAELHTVLYTEKKKSSKTKLLASLVYLNAPKRFFAEKFFATSPGILNLFYCILWHSTKDELNIFDRVSASTLYWNQLKYFILADQRSVRLYFLLSYYTASLLLANQNSGLIF